MLNQQIGVSCAKACLGVKGCRRSGDTVKAAQTSVGRCSAVGRLNVELATEPQRCPTSRRRDTYCVWILRASPRTAPTSTFRAARETSQITVRDRPSLVCFNAVPLFVFGVQSTSNPLHATPSKSVGYPSGPGSRKRRHPQKQERSRSVASTSFPAAGPNFDKPKDPKITPSLP